MTLSAKNFTAKTLQPVNKLTTDNFHYLKCMNVPLSKHSKTEDHNNMLWHNDNTREQTKAVHNVHFQEYTFFIGNDFVSNLVLDSLKFKKVLELQGKS